MSKLGLESDFKIGRFQAPRKHDLSCDFVIMCLSIYLADSRWLDLMLESIFRIQ